MMARMTEEIVVRPSDEMRAWLNDARVTSEPLTYTRSSTHSYFQDLARFKDRQDTEARVRLERHATEIRSVVADREQRAWATGRERGFEFRITPNRTDGTGGFGSPPLWIMDAIASVPRAPRALANLIPTFPLPTRVGEVNVPRLTTGTLVGTVLDGGTAVTRDITDAAVTSPVVTIAGQSDMALQLLEQSPAGGYLDHVIFRDLRESYDYQLERQLLSGTGTGAQILGVLNVPTGAGLASAVTYTDGTPTAAELVPFVGQAVAQLGNSRLRPPECLLMRTARWAWIGSAAWPTSQSKTLIGYDVVEDDAIPATLGAGGNQDAIIGVRPSDMLLLESTPRVTVDFESGSGVLGVRLQLRAYVAALVARYPTAIVTLQGTGMIPVSGFG